MIILIVSNDNMESVKEALYFHCKGRKSLKIGGLMKLRQIVDSVINDTSRNKYRVVEVCHFLRDQGYLEIHNGNSGNIFSSDVHFITPKLWKEMQEQEHEELIEQQDKLW